MKRSPCTNSAGQRFHHTASREQLWLCCLGQRPTEMHKNCCVSALVTQRLRDRFQAVTSTCRDNALRGAMEDEAGGLDKCLSRALTSNPPEAKARGWHHREAAGAANNVLQGVRPFSPYLSAWQWL